MHGNCRPMLILCPKGTEPKAQDHFFNVLLHLNHTGKTNDISEALHDLTSTCLIQQNLDISGTVRWIKGSSDAHVSVTLSRSSPLGTPAWVLCSPGMSPNWLVLPNRPCTGSDGCVSVQTLLASMSQVAHTPSIAARQNTADSAHCWRPTFLEIPPHMKVCIVLLTPFHCFSGIKQSFLSYTTLTWIF